MASSSLTINNSSYNNNNNNTTIQMRPIELDEFDQINQSSSSSSSSSSLIVANLTKLLLEHFNEQIKIDLIEFDSNKSNNQEEQDELNSYFYIIDTQLNSTTTSTFLLKLNRNKRIDRELICPFVTTTTNSSTTLTNNEEECILNVNFYLNKMFHLILPIKINDINDMKPFFYQNEIQIDMLSDIILEQQKQNKMMPFNMMFVSMQQRIPLKMAIDLDATRQNRILNYTLSSSSSDNQTNEFITIKYVHEKSLDLYVNMTKLIWQQQQQQQSQEKDLIKIFYLRAYDSMYTSEQMIRIKFSKILFQKREREQTKKKLETFAIFEKNFFNFSLKSVQHEHSIQLSVNLKKNILLGDVDHYNKASHSISIKKSIEEEEEESATNGNVVCQNGQIKFELFNLTPNGRRQVNMSKISTDNYNHYLNIEFNKNNESQLKLIATCLNTKQKDVALIMLNYLLKTTTTKLLNLNMISALNQFDLTKAIINNQTIFEIRFKNSSLVNIINHINNTTLLTMAYLMIDNESSRSIFNVHILKQHLISHKESKLNSDMDIFQLNQMRNGLYAISLSNRDFIETFLSSSSKNDDEEEKFDLKLEFSIRANKEEEEKLSFLLIKDLSLSKNFTLNVLRKMNDDTNDEFYSTKKLNTSNSLSDSKMISSNNNSLNLFNSVIIITTASIILVIFGITCFIVSISLYITSKCRLLNKLKTTTSKKKKTTTTNGTNTNNLSFYSQHLSSSSSSSSSSPRVTNTQTNVSPATSIMTSLEIIQKSSSTSLGSSSSSSLRSHSKNNITNSNQQNDRQLIICSALSSSSSSTSSSSSSNNSTRALSTKKKKSSLSSSTSHAPINTIMVYDMMPPPTSSLSTSNTPPQPPPLPPPSHLGKF
jgi:hypothetical protein